MTALKPVTRVALLVLFAFSLSAVMLSEVRRKTLKISFSVEAPKTPESRLSRLINSGWGKLMRGGDRAARRFLSWQGVTAKGLLAASAARLFKKVLKLRPSKVVWLVVKPIAKPPHSKDVTCMLSMCNIITLSIV